MLAEDLSMISLTCGGFLGRPFVGGLLFFCRLEFPELLNEFGC